MSTYRTMRKLITLFICCTLLSVATPASAETNPFTPVFSEVILDLPIMPGLNENPETAVIFDKAEGRFIETTAAGKIKMQTVKLFYNKALPPLGWTPVTDTVFHRDQEVLTLDIQQTTGEQVNVSFTLSPQK